MVVIQERYTQKEAAKQLSFSEINVSYYVRLYKEKREKNFDYKKVNAKNLKSVGLARCHNRKK